MLIESTYGDRLHEAPIDFAKALAPDHAIYVSGGRQSGHTGIFRRQDTGNALLYPQDQRGGHAV